ncbi:MAG: M28 family peptidase [Planctomycetota bacterium]
MSGARLRSRALVALFGLGGAGVLPAQDDVAVPAPSPLTAAETAAMARIDEGVVRATIAFLASDELGGRDTPSPGLRIASAYVAARFAGAGLEGLGEGEGCAQYYLESAMNMTALPSRGLELRDGSGADLAHLGLLAAAPGDAAVELAGALFDAGTGLPQDGVSPYPEADIAGAVLVGEQPPERVRKGWPASYAALMPLRRQVKEAERRGATAMLVRVGPQSPLLEMAASLRDKPVARDRLRFATMPVVLVPEDWAADAIQLRVPPRVRTAEVVRNVCGVLRGSDPARRQEAILISAHLDHIGTGTGEGDRIYNGADDDASGVTAVLALADAFAALPEPPARSLLFMTFWGEEKGLRGSRAFCDDPAWLLDDIVANVNLEMLGRPEEDAQHKAWMTGWKHSDLGELMAPGAARGGVELFRHPRYSAMLYGASDNASFVREGLVAHSFSAGSLHDDYHQPGDEWQTLDLPHMTKVIQGLFCGVLPLAHGDLTPQRR